MVRWWAQKVYSELLQKPAGTNKKYIKIPNLLLSGNLLDIELLNKREFIYWFSLKADVIELIN